MFNSIIKTKLNKLIHFKKAGGSILYLAARFISPGNFSRQLLNPSELRPKTHSARRINSLKTSRTKSYLEIGMHNGGTFEQVNINLKHGIEPFPKFNTRILPANTELFEIKSDEFFKSYCNSMLYDFVYIDGSHEFRQVGRDLLNSLNHLSDGGRILMDDMIPSDSISSIADMEISKIKRQIARLPGNPNHGDCFKLLPFIFEHLSFIQPYLIIYPDNPQLLLVAPSNFRDFFNIQKISIAFENYNFNDLTFEELFDSNKLKQYPIYIEELLLNHLKNKN